MENEGGYWMTMMNMDKWWKTNAVGMETIQKVFQTNPGWRESIKK
jgi:hypothetical protein